MAMFEFTIDNRVYVVNRSGGPLDEVTLSLAEMEMGTKLPAELRDFMLRFNGGLPVPNNIPEDISVHVRLRWKPSSAAAARSGRNTNLERIYRINGDPSVNLVRANKDFKGRIPADTITFGYDAGGSQFLIGTGDENRGKILFWARGWESELDDDENPNYDNVAEVANSFVQFLKGMAPEPGPDESDEDWEKRYFPA
jgi:hypothetical protein